MRLRAALPTACLALALLAVPPAGAELPRLQLRLLELGTTAEKLEATRQLLALRDPEAIEPLLAALATPDSELQAAILRGLVEAFPERTSEELPRLLDSPVAEQRIGATYGLALIERSDIADLLLPLLDDPDPEIVRAALYSVSLQLRPLVRVALARALDEAPAGMELPAAETELLHRFREGLLDLLRRREGEPWPHAGVGWLAMRLADADFARASLEAWREGLPREQARLGRIVERLARAQRAWLGRPDFPAGRELRFELEAHNLLTGGELTGTGILSSGDVEALRIRSVDLARVSLLSLPADLLVALPGFARPELVGLARGIATIEYELPEGQVLRTGVGSVVGAAYATSSVEASRMRLRLRARTGRPLEETALDEDGRELARWSYGDWARVRGAAWAPRRLDVDVSRPADGPPVRYSFGFRCDEAGACIVSDASARTVSDRGEALTATLSVQAEWIRRRAGSPAPDPASGG